MPTLAPRAPHSAAPATPSRLTRRSVTRGAAWAIPTIMIGAAAPLAAASPCAPQHYVLDWGGGTGTTYTRNSATSGTAIVDPDGAGPIAQVVMTISAQFVGDMEATTSAPANLAVTAGQIGGTGQVGLALHQAITTPRGDTQPQRSARQVVTFSFSEPVRNLQFTLTDIDSTEDDFIDRIELSPTATVAPVTTWVTGLGTQASALRPTNDDRSVPDTSADGNARVTYAGPLSSFTMTYWNATTTRARGVDPDQVVGFTDFAFDVVRNNC